MKQLQQQLLSDVEDERASHLSKLIALTHQRQLSSDLSGVFHELTGRVW